MGQDGAVTDLWALRHCPSCPSAKFTSRAGFIEPGVWRGLRCVPAGSLHLLLRPCRLIGGLASENVRWAESVEMFREQEKTLCGDVLLISAFVSYVGYFTKKYRAELMEKYWIPYLEALKVSGCGAPPGTSAPCPGTKGPALLGGRAPNIPPMAGAHPHHPGAGPPQPPHRCCRRGCVEQPGAAQRPHVHRERHHPLQHPAVAAGRGRPAAGHQVDQEQIRGGAESNPAGPEEVGQGGQLPTPCALQALHTHQSQGT